MHQITEQNLQRLVEIAHRLRSPDGCLWDKEQTPETLARYLLEEAYEVIDAIEQGRPEALKEELGDLLFQIILLAGIAAESGSFDLADVMEAAGDKMIRRHPHVFGDVAVSSVHDINENWENIKRSEKAPSTYRERFGKIAKTLPALLKAQKITKEAAKAGFDWEKTEDVFAKVEEELEEVREAIKSGQPGKREEEIGDVLFSLVNLSRFLDVDAEAALRLAMQKFIRRFSDLEDALGKEGKKPDDVSLAELDRLWEEAKQRETG